jgi:tRNA G18 (ribose-2'-O)-methylase SpoU
MSSPPHRVPVTCLDLPELAPYRTLRRYEEHRARGVFVAEGDKVVHRLLASDLEVISLLVSTAREAEFAAALGTHAPHATLFVTTPEMLHEVVGFHLHQGVLALARVPASRDVEPLAAALPRPQLWVALDGLNNAENVGVLIRNAAALGAQALLAGETSSSPWLRRTVRNSMGAIFKLPVVESASLAADLARLRARGVRCLAAHPHTDQRRLAETDLTGDVCLVFGNEGHGVSPAVLGACDAHIAIPMAGGVDSLNVASTSAAFLYEAARQRGLG